MEAIAAQEKFHISEEGKRLPSEEVEIASEAVSLNIAGPFYLYFRIKDVCRYYHAAAQAINNPEEGKELKDLVGALSE